MHSEAPSRLCAVLLDAGRTLLFERPTRFEIYADAAREWGLTDDPAAVRRAMTVEHDLLPWVGGETVRYTDDWFREYVPNVYRSLGAPDSQLAGITDELLTRFRKTAVFHLYPETLEVLDALRARGLRLAVVSNWSPRLLGHLDRLDLRRRLDDVLVSAIEGLEKPAPALFERACARLGVAPGEAIHVGDHAVKDVAGARAAGLRAVLLDREETKSNLRPSLETIGSLRALLPIVDSTGDAA